MNAEEILLIRDIRRMFDKLPVDSARMEVQTTRGHVTLSGQVKNFRSHPLEVVKDHVDEAERRLRKDPRIKTLTMALRVVQMEKKEQEHFAAPTIEHHDAGGGSDD